MKQFEEKLEIQREEHAQRFQQATEELKRIRAEQQAKYIVRLELQKIKRTAQDVMYTPAQNAVCAKAKVSIL